MAERLPRIVQTLCAECDGRVYQAAKSHRHYTYLFSTNCPQQKVVQIKMRTVQWR